MFRHMPPEATTSLALTASDSSAAPARPERTKGAVDDGALRKFWLRYRDEHTLPEGLIPALVGGGVAGGLR